MSKDKTGFEKAKDFIIKAGFSHIKLEMEADLGREDDEYECSECYGDGRVDCNECDGSGEVSAERPNGSYTDVECDDCYGDGRISCEDCDGSGQHGGGEQWTVSRCEEWIKDNVSVGARDALTYSQFYYDGSVDSEMTLTMPVKNAEYMVEYLEAFKALSEEIGNGLETGGAGLHICVIPAEAAGGYPVPRNTLPSNKYNNFEHEVTKLLPALFMLASADGISRGLSYRKPTIASDEKYSAIYAGNRSSLEYRLFETCYDNPEMVKEYVEVIAKTLRFYHNPSLKVKHLGMSFRLGDASNRTSRFYQSPEAIKVLRTQLQYLKPEGRTVSELMKSREVPNLTELKKQQSAKRKQLRSKWYADKRRIETLKKQPLTERQLRRRAEILEDGYYTEMTVVELDNHVRGIEYEQQSLIDYLNRNLIPQNNSWQNSCYTINV